MKLQVVHRTRYDYASPVTDSFNEARLQPLNAAGQTCHSFLLRVLPAAKLSHYPDFYANCVHFFEVTQPHPSLSVESTSIVTTTHPAMPADGQTFPMSQLPECARMERCFDYLQDSDFVSLAPEVWRLAVDAVGGETDIWRAALAIMRFVHSQFTYETNATNVHTRILEVLRDRRGVCQDFAHVMIGMCRTLGIPALYVSGYLYNGPTEHLLGAQATHAWVEVFLPDFGWCGLDPTNNQRVNDHYVKVAVGRDYGDVSPLRGNYRGTAEKKLSVEVQVNRMDG